MKILTLSAVLCLVASTAVADKKRTGVVSTHVELNSDRDLLQAEARHHEVSGMEARRHQGMMVKRHDGQHKEHGVEAHKDGKRSSNDDDEDKDDEDEADDSADEDDDEDEKEKKDDEPKKGDSGGSKKDGGKGKGAPAGGKKGAPAGGRKGAPAKGGKDAAKTAPGKGVDAGGDKKGGATNGDLAGTVSDPNIPKDLASPLWLVQPYGASIWEQGRAYVISWGPNPDPILAKALKPNTPIDVRLMQGPPDSLRDVAVLTADIDSSLNSFQWTVPTTIPPANDYSIRLSHEGLLDTYSHYFEISAAGDARSSPSNVGQPLEMPQKGDVVVTNPPLDDKSKPATPPNPVPEDIKPVVDTPPKADVPVAAKPVTHVASGAFGETHQNANMLAFALTLFGAVYLL
ncbi:hypothetical protein BGZ70_004109 [Mortierella alpina]|uniref:Yeast cell wall synthesis Kre9/Knh1-like N-terminal domain-containing protein n=1 Tax=Mortierella alpina TaxID=64518 RepID=A0A9P6JAA4_MORAP|nr:hypothetical protein BGZ70_004109 [Mortierella alpina]